MGRGIIRWLSSKYDDLEPYKTKKYSNHIFFMKDSEVIFDYNKENGYVCISYDKIWSFLESFFGLKNEEIGDLTKEWVEEHYKLRVAATFIPKFNKFEKVEEDYKLNNPTN